LLERQRTSVTLAPARLLPLRRQLAYILRMCGRYNITDDPMLAALLAELGIDLVLPTQINIAPTDQVPVVFQQEQGRRLETMHWWLQPTWVLASSGETSTRYAMFNARCENLQSSKAFSGPFKYRRAIMPASSFIEWQKVPPSTQTPKGKQAQLIEFENRALGFAAVYERGEIDGQEFLSCAIVTRPATAAFDSIHSRMPVTINAAMAEEWLDSSVQLDESFAAFSAPIDAFKASPLSSRINNARNKRTDDLQITGPAQRLH